MVHLSKLFILRPIMTTLVMIALFIFGLTSYFKLPVSSLPDVDYPVITVTVPFPGANPETMANTVATPLEQQFMGIAGIKSVTSANTLGQTQIILEFDVDKNIDLAAVDVQSAIVAATPLLPPNLPQSPTFKKVNPSSSPVIYFSIYSPTMTLGELYDYAYTFIGQRIAIIDGVAQVQVYGSPFAVRAQISPGHLASLGMTAADVATALANANQYQPLGQTDGDYVSEPIYDTGGLDKADQFNDIIIKHVNGSPVRFKDIGNAIDSIQMDRGFRGYVDKKGSYQTVTLAVLRQPGANTVRLVDEIHKLMPSLIEQLPGSLEIVELFDRSASIRESIHEVEFTLFIAFILVVLVVFFYLGRLRETVIPSLVMPMSILVTFGIMYPLGYTIDNLSLLAMILAIGFIIDDAIVVLENIVRRVEIGESPKVATLEGSHQISFTIVSMTVSLVAVFIPLIFMAGVVGKLFKEFSVVLMIVTLLSGIISLTLTPMLCALFIKPHRGDTKVHHFSKKINDWMLHYYKHSLHWALKHRLIVILIGTVCVFLSIIFFIILPKDFIPDEDLGFIIAYTESSQGTSSEKMTELQKQVTDLLINEESVESIITLTATGSYRQGIMFLRLIPLNKRKSIQELIPFYNKILSQVPGINVYLKPLPLIDLNVGAQVRGSYQFLVQSLNPTELYSESQKLIDVLKSDPYFQGVSTDLEIKSPQVYLDIDRDLAYSLGVDVLNLERGIYLGYSGNRISRIQSPINQYDVIVELERSLQRSPNSLNEIYVRSTNQNMVPLNAIVSKKERVGPSSVNHFDQFPSVNISFNINQDIPLSDALNHLRKLAEEHLPPTVNGDLKGAAEAFEESMHSLTFLFLITIVVIYIVLGMLYESFIHPLTILSTLPPAVFGGLFVLFLFNLPLSLYAFLGLILLIGIVKKNGIMMVDFALENVRLKNESPEKSIVDACVVRFRPIMMTTFAAIMGAIPIAMGTGIGAVSRRPLGFVIIGGMCISQLITLFLTPVLYLCFEELRERYLPKNNLNYNEPKKEIL